MMDKCLSRFQLDQFHANEIDPVSRKEIEVHLGNCENCRKYLVQLDGYKEAFLRNYPPNRFYEKLAVAKKGGARDFIFSPALKYAVSFAVLALIVIGIVEYWQSDSQKITPLEPERIGLKGGFSVTVYRKKGTVSERVDWSQAVFFPQDELRFEVFLPKKMYLCALSLEATGRAFLFFPLPGETVKQLGPGLVLLPQSAVLDESLSQDKFFFVAQETRFEPSTLLQEIQQQYRQVQGQGRNLATFSFKKKGFEIFAFTLHKKRR